MFIKNLFSNKNLTLYSLFILSTGLVYTIQDKFKTDQIKQLQNENNSLYNYNKELIQQKLKLLQQKIVQFDIAIKYKK